MQTRYVWLAKVDVWFTEWGQDVYGIFSTPGNAKRVCQDVADEYFGKRNRRRPLGWQGDDDFSFASYHDPAVGSYYFTVRRFAVDRAKDH